MVFSSIIFLWYFLPIALGVYYAFTFIKDKSLQTKCKNIWLLIASFVFYACGGLVYLLIMIVSIIGNYLFALRINHNQTKEKSAKLWLVLSIIFNLGILFYFKYTNFFVGIIENIANHNFGLKEVVLPIGISFYTFQSMSYVIDVYNKKAKCQKNIFNLALYISLFSQLIAGPIIKYSTIENQINARTETVDMFVNGIQRFMYGLAKKVIIANTVGEVAKNILMQSNNTFGTSLLWLGVICYAIQIYYDFSGYSDMAVGIGKMFGFDFPENFNYPYMATSIRDFWRRWHISLSTWFKEYVYIPLGGNRKGKIRTYINLFIVFFLTGLWHGANFTFVIWGLVFGLFMVIERLFLGKLLDKNKIKFFNWLYTMFVVVVLWVLFCSDSISQAFDIIKNLFVFRKNYIAINNVASLWQIIVLMLGILFCGPIQKICKKPLAKVKDTKWFFSVNYIFQFCLYIICINLIISNSFNPFIYFQF